MKCFLNYGERWEDCPDHLNIDGKHGLYKCKWIKEPHAPTIDENWTCLCPTRKEEKIIILEDDLFEL